MNMGVVVQLTGPGVKDAEQTQWAAEELGFGGHGLKGGSGLFKEEVQEVLLLGIAESTQLLGQSKGDQEVGHRKDPCLLFLTPASRRGLPASGASSMLTGMVGQMAMTAGTMIEMSPPLFGAAREDGPDRCFLRRQDLGTKLLAIGWPMTAQHCGKFDHWKGPAG
jgi:hypothetical protein